MLSVVENVSQRLDDLEQLVQVVTSTGSSSKAGEKGRIPSQLTVCNGVMIYPKFYPHVYILYRKLCPVFIILMMIILGVSLLWLYYHLILYPCIFRSDLCLVKTKRQNIKGST